MTYWGKWRSYNWIYTKINDRGYRSLRLLIQLLKRVVVAVRICFHRNVYKKITSCMLHQAQASQSVSDCVVSLHKQVDKCNCNNTVTWHKRTNHRSAIRRSSFQPPWGNGHKIVFMCSIEPARRVVSLIQAYIFVLLQTVLHEGYKIVISSF